MTQIRVFLRRAPRGRVNAPHAPPSTSSWAGEVAGAVRRQFYLGGLRQKAGSLVIMALRRTRKPQAASQVKKYQFAAFHAALACGLRLARSARGPHASTRQASEHPSSPARQKLSRHSFILETAACADAEPPPSRRAAQKLRRSRRTSRVDMRLVALPGNQQSLTVLSLGNQLFNFSTGAVLRIFPPHTGSH